MSEIDRRSPERRSPEAERLFQMRRCPVCGCRDSEAAYPIDKDYASFRSGVDLGDIPVGVSRCEKCGHQYIQPVPEPEFLTAFYENYLTVAKGGFYRDRAREEISVPLRRRYEGWLERVRSLGGGESLMDVGSGLGTFLRLAREGGFAVDGVEPNGEAAVMLRERYGLQVYNCMLEDLAVPAHYGVVTMWDLLEHLPDPGAAVDRVGELLGHRGLLVIETPVRDSLIHGLAKAIYRVSAGRICGPLFGVCGVHHLQYFSERSLLVFLADHGFEVLEVHRDQTEVRALARRPRGSGGARRLEAAAYNWLMGAVFLAARLAGKQNKAVVFARKRDRDA